MLYLSNGRPEYEMNIKKTSQTETAIPPKKRGYRLWVIRFALLLGLSVLLYYGYCWGLWGRNSLLLQYLFQCNCPIASEQVRYSDGIEVIVSACKYHSSILSPSGRLMYVQEEESRITSTYLLDLQTEEKIPFTLREGSNHFLTDDLIFYSFYGDDEYIWDITTDKQYPIQRFTRVRSNAYVNGELNLKMLAEALRDAKQVYLIDNDIVVALVSDFRTSPEHNFLTGWFDIPGNDHDRVEQFLRENEITYHYISDSFSDEAISPDGRFIARHDGIYLIEANQKIVEGYSASGNYRSYSGKYFSVRGWTYDGTGVIYSKFLDPCLIEVGLIFMDEVGCFIQVSQPLLKLNLPDEYLFPAETP